MFISRQERLVSVIAMGILLVPALTAAQDAFQPGGLGGAFGGGRGQGGPQFAPGGQFNPTGATPAAENDEAQLPRSDQVLELV